MKIEAVAQLAGRIQENIEQVIVGKPEVIQKTVLCLLCEGHILLEDIPGMGKTTLAKALARSVDCAFGRIQFTPDLLPGDLTGINFYNQKTGEFVFKRGAVFTGILLADEVNRATPRTQSSLLECMEERQVTVDGVCYPLERPFLVIATQNPVETQGTFPLPEAQLDRFFMRLSVGYPEETAEEAMLERFLIRSPLQSLSPVVSREELLEAQEAVRQVCVSSAVRQYIVELARLTRSHEKIRLGVSPRGSLALLHAAQGCAAIHGRDYVIPDDVKEILPDVFCHRLITRSRGYSQNAETPRELLRQLMVQAPVPTEEGIERS
ncbi:MAG: MoxR family ATPase [Provencibacterium sp.]|nr:MoxR family ATPase [Provencibacterium sp.]